MSYTVKIELNGEVRDILVCAAGCSAESARDSAVEEALEDGFVVGHVISVQEVQS